MFDTEIHNARERAMETLDSTSASNADIFSFFVDEQEFQEILQRWGLEETEETLGLPVLEKAPILLDEDEMFTIVTEKIEGGDDADHLWDFIKHFSNYENTTGNSYAEIMQNVGDNAGQV